MAITPYDRITNLQNDQALAPTDPYPAQKLDQEYNALKVTTDDIIQHLDLIQRDDGQLENDSVGIDQLRDEVLIGFNAPTPWETDHDYIVGDTVFQDNSFWFCEIAHLSGVFIDDQTAGKWSLIANFTDAATVGARMYVGDNPPAFPAPGQQWFESDTGNTFVYVDDGTSQQWVHSNGASGAESAIAGLAMAVLRPTQLTSDQNNYAPAGLATCGILELQGDAIRNITGFSAAGMGDGQVIYINNVGGFNIVFKNLSASSSGPNQFICPGMVDFTLTPNAAFRLYYSASIWRAL